jgi:hypothetical protein
MISKTCKQWNTNKLLKISYSISRELSWYSLAYQPHPQRRRFSSLIDHFYLARMHGHLSALSSLYKVAPPLHSLYRPHQGSSHKYLTNPLSSEIPQFQSEIAADSKNINFILKNQEICKWDHNFLTQTILLFPFSIFNNKQCQQNTFFLKVLCNNYT